MPSSLSIGVGLRHPHYQDVLEQRPPIDWFEVHSENFFHLDSPALDSLLKIRQRYPISLHGIGLSLGSAEGVMHAHLTRLNTLITRVEPFIISEHLSWSVVAGRYIPDLLPIPYNQESFTLISRNIAIAQEFLKRPILIENPSSYVEYKDSDRQEVDFLISLCINTGCKLLLDINNVYVSSKNHGWNARDYINAIPSHLVGEIHLAGHTLKTLDENTTLLIDTHDDFVCEEVWALYALAIARFGLVPTLLEWDENIPKLDVLVQEALRARDHIKSSEHA